MRGAIICENGQGRGGGWLGLGESIEKSINVSNKEYSNIELKFQMRKEESSKMKEKKKMLVH